MAQPPASPAPREDLAGPLGAFHTPRIAAAQRRFWLTIDAMLVALVVVASIGGWAYFQVRGSLRDLRSAGLVSLLEAEVRGMRIWIDEKKRDAERWASTPSVRREVATLAPGAGPASACAAGPQRVLREEIAPYAAVEEADRIQPDRTRRAHRFVVASRELRAGGVRANSGSGCEPVFAGRTVFVPPIGELDRLPTGARLAEGALAWVEAPVRGADGSVVAALGFGRRAEDRFARLLALTVEGTSRDAYAFDERGRLLTPPRFAAALAGRAGEVRDPGGEPPPGHPAPSPASAQALTALAAAAIEHHDASEGVLLTPYRNYRGAEVIGAWRWIARSADGRSPSRSTRRRLTSPSNTCRWASACCSRWCWCR